MKKLLIALPVALSLALLTGFTKGERKSEPKPVKVFTNGKTTVNAYEWDGLEYFLNKKNDTTYVVNFWATWCVPCVQELPYFEQLAEKYKNEKVKVILVSLDMPKQAESRLLPFIERKKIKSRVILMRDPDQNTWLPKVNADWSGAIPATVIYNKSKRKFYERSFTLAELETEFNSINK
jgi:thiol-disulfide isomerase/thioredoxin